MQVALAVTVHDPNGRITPGIERTASALTSVFSGIAVNATEPTQEGLLRALRDIGAAVMTHASGNVVGESRRNAVALALDTQPDRVLYSDLDHVIRWVESDLDELHAVVTRPDAEDMVVVGRTPTAFARSPARLRETEAIVNRVYTLVTGRDADLMFAIRLLSRATAEAVVMNCMEATIASDVEWPMYAERDGRSVGYVAAEGLDYRTTDDFDTRKDERDADPEAWIHRVNLAAQHLAVMRRFMNGNA